ncbi:DUF1996 domain-containing protein [Luteimicrobium subarcticum]|uniref:F5/8 type C domain-containing protein n=1 Tax=Luteimicrobium subarcticum TaxID=620910 RepID=A0A2M8WVW9_9MICO|nr:DUF1996 domain-containing protein [Luteimicrobium subarcticum]PJI95068.1 F5/8 type C domain-containing protein [Luteimicrobium subarcticum]
MRNTHHPEERRRSRVHLAVAGAAVAALAAAGGLMVLAPSASAAAVNISDGKTATASSSEGADFVASKAVDDNTATRWSSQWSDAQWIQVDLGATASVDHVDIQWEAAYAKAFQVQLSNDGTTWTTVKSVTGATGGNQSVAASGSGRYVRLNLTQRATQYGYSIFEVDVFGTGGATPPAYTPRPLPTPPAGVDATVTHHEFQMNCTVNHTAFDDPLVLPGQFGKSHNHSFMGNLDTNAASTPDTLMTGSGTSCTVAQDKSAYWFPTLYRGDKQVISPDLQTIYYKSGIVDYKKVQPFPAGLRFYAGSPFYTSPTDFKNAPGTVEGWECGDSTKNWSIPTYCAPGSQLNMRYQAPSCWDGVHLDSADHRSHMAYPVNGECPADHPVPVPMIEMKISWPVSGDMTGVHLANMTMSDGSVMSVTWHYDFMNGWDQTVLSALTQHCIDGGLQCNPHGYDLYKPWAGTVLDDTGKLVWQPA